MRSSPSRPTRTGPRRRTAVVLCNLGTPDAPTPAAVRRYLARVPERSARRRDPAPASGGRSCTASSCAFGRRARRASTRASGRRKARRSRSGPRSRRCCSAAISASAATASSCATRCATARRRSRRCSTRSRRPAPIGSWCCRSIRSIRPRRPAASATRSRRGCGASATFPELRLVKHYHDDAGYIDALAARVNEHWRVNGRADRLVLSFHGLPRRSLTLGDPYHCECLKTARLLAERLKVREDFVAVTFQSRFGRAEWLQPYTEPTLVALARAGVGRVDVLLPRLHLRLPRDARGDRPGSARRLPRRRRQGVPVRRLPERPARMDRRPGRRRHPPPPGLGHRPRSTPTTLESERRRRLAAGAAGLIPVDSGFGRLRQPCAP